MAEQRRREAEKKAEELRIAREKEEAERKAQEESEEIPPEDIGPEDFVEVEKAEDDILERPIDVGELDPEEFFKEVAAEEVETPVEPAINDDNPSQSSGSGPAPRCCLLSLPYSPSVLPGSIVRLPFF